MKPNRELVWVGIVLVGVICLPGTGCKSAMREEQLLQELANLDKEEIFQRGEALFAEKEWADARRYFSFVYDTFPNDPLGHKAALRIADTYSAKRDTMSTTEARLRYKDFANRYPNDPDRDYALLMLGKTNTPRRLHPDRDLTPVREALAAYQQLINLYPNSKYFDEGRTNMAQLRAVLAEHEYLAARFYARNNRWQGVVWRLEYLKENYPDFPEMEKVDTLLAQAQEIFDAWHARVERLKQEAEAKKAESETDLTTASPVE